MPNTIDKAVLKQPVMVLLRPIEAALLLSHASRMGSLVDPLGESRLIEQDAWRAITAAVLVALSG